MKFLIPFTKFHGLGNDFVILDARELARDKTGLKLLSEWRELCPSLAKYLCSRNFGIGADGLILALPMKSAEYDLVDISHGSQSVEDSGRFCKVGSDYPRRHDRRTNCDTADSFVEIDKAISDITTTYDSASDCDLAWVYTNSDGSEAGMCGNGLRALALWTANNMESVPKNFSIATAIGPVNAEVFSEDSIRVELGKPALEAGLIPVRGSDSGSDNLVGYPLKLDSGTVKVTCIGMGNPHAVIFDQFDNEVSSSFLALDKDMHTTSFFPDKLKEIAQSVQANPFFPEGVNVEFARRVKDDFAEVLVYERGCGATFACASGACAVVVAGVLEGRLSRKSTVRLPGGKLDINWHEDSGRLEIEGSAREVFSGVVWVNLEEIEDGSRRIAVFNA